MPYIGREDRKYIGQEFRVDSFGGVLAPAEIGELIRRVPSGKVKGAFNYFVSRLWLHTFFGEEYYKELEKSSLGYTKISDALAVFNDMETEMRRRLLDKYEDDAIDNNGDLPELECLMPTKRKEQQ